MRMFMIPVVSMLFGLLSACHLETSTVAQNGTGGADGGTPCQCPSPDAGIFYPDAADYTADAGRANWSGGLPDGGAMCTCGGGQPDASRWEPDAGSASGCDGGGFGAPDAGAYVPDAF